MRGLREIRERNLKAIKEAGYEHLGLFDLWPGDPGFEEQEAQRKQENEALTTPTTYLAPLAEHERDFNSEQEAKKQTETHAASNEHGIIPKA